MVEIRFDSRMEYQVDNIGFVRVERGKNFTFCYKNGKNRHSFIIVKNGSLNYNFIKSGTDVTVKKGDILFIPKHYPYIAEYLENGTAIHLFLFDCAVPGEKNPFIKPVKKIIPAVFNSLLNITSSDARNTLFLASKIYELLCSFEKSEAKIPARYKKIMPAMQELKEKYFENQKMSYYAGICSMSESNFRRLFKEYTGTSPVEYRNTIRIFEAAKMIESGEFTASEAAYLTGFNNMSFFYEMYKKVTR